MILYNVTVKIDHAVHDDWKAWMCDVHIPEIMDTGLFHEYKMCKLIGIEEEDGITYAIQYVSPDMNSFQEYQEKHAARLQQDHMKRFENRYVAFRTLMEVVSS